MTTKTADKPEPTTTPVAEMVELSRLKVWPKNPDAPTAKDVRTIARSVKRWGWGEPILARLENGEIIAGHARYLAAKRLKMTEVPVRFMNLSEGEAHALALADNKIAANRKRDWGGESVAEALEELEAMDVELTRGTGFSEEEIDAALETDLADSADDTGSEMDSGLKYEIVVECRDEHHQAELLEEWEALGLVCKPVMS